MTDMNALKAEYDALGSDEAREAFLARLDAEDAERDRRLRAPGALAAAAGCSLDDVPTLTDLAALAGLIDDDAGSTRSTELGDAWKRRHSHRARAAAALREAIP